MSSLMHATTTPRCTDNPLSIEIEHQHVARCASTQVLARGELASTGARALVISTDHQTDGHGREGRSWSDMPGQGLLATIAFRGPISLDVLSDLPLRAAQAVAQTIVPDAATSVTIKPPNDLYVRDRKLGGVLIDVTSDSHAVRELAIGVGVNLRGPWREIDGRKATSCEAEWGSQCMAAQTACAALAPRVARTLAGIVLRD